MIHTKVKHIQIGMFGFFFLQSHISLQEDTPFTKKINSNLQVN